jgi:hypothetical protein
LTLPLCPLTVLHLLGRCHCVFYGCHWWRGPRVPYSRGRGMAPHSPRHCTVRPSFLGTLVGSRILALVPVPDPLSRLFIVGVSLARLLAQRTSTPLHAAFVPGALRHHLRPPDYKCHLACLSSIPPPDLKPLEVELRDLVVACRSKVANLRGWSSSAERIWFPLKKFKFISG